VIAGILLAAGRSLRMGQPKLLLPWDGAPLVRHVAQLALRSSLDELVVVIGYRAEHVSAALAGLPLRIVHNQAFLDGQSTSLRVGIAALSSAAEAAVLLLADQPLLQPATIDALIERYRAQQAPVVVPRYAGQRGNPVLFARELFAALQTIGGDQGARGVIQQQRDRVEWLDTADEGVLLDIDTPDMYQRLLDRNAGAKDG
jgi:molybdenum cofactor cytidylyltransferase